jgi:hypothetical protein
MGTPCFHFFVLFILPPVGRWAPLASKSLFSFIWPPVGRWAPLVYALLLVFFKTKYLARRNMTEIHSIFANMPHKFHEKKSVIFGEIRKRKKMA